MNNILDISDIKKLKDIVKQWVPFIGEIDSKKELLEKLNKIESVLKYEM